MMGFGGSYIAYSAQMAPAVRSYELIKDEVASGGGITTFTITGLDLATDGTWLVEMNIQNGATSSGMRLFANGDTTTTNYYTAITAVSNEAWIHQAGPGNNGKILSVFHMRRDAAGYPRAVGTVTQGAANITAQTNPNWSWMHTSTTNVTSLSLVAATANQIADGTRIRIWRLPATTAGA